MEDFMWENVLEVVLNYGIMTVLFVCLLVWVLKDARTRERKYQTMVDKLHGALSVVSDIQSTTKEIYKEVKELKERKTNVNVIKKTVAKNPRGPWVCKKCRDEKETTERLLRTERIDVNI